jgi:transcriptional regulator with XRE-family HTH domain
MSLPEPYYADESVTLYLGDALEVLAAIEAGSVSAIVTDPPYGLEFMGREWDSFKPAGAKLRTRIDLRTNPAEGKSVTTTPESYVAGRPYQAWCTKWAAECLRILKPGGHILAFGGTRTWHRLTCAIEDAGFEIRDSVADLTGVDGPGLLWLYGSGFPKSLDVSKAIDKRRDWASLSTLQTMIRNARTTLGISQSEAARRAGILAAGESLGGGGYMWFETGLRIPTAGQYAALKVALNLDDSCDLAFQAAEREVLGETTTSRNGGSWAEQVNSGIFRVGERVMQTTAPATEDAARWEGWGTALKAAWEPIVVARKPLGGPVAANVLEHGTGALNVNGCRVGDPEGKRAAGTKAYAAGNLAGETDGTGVLQAAPHDGLGRWPANVVLGETAAAELDRQSGVLTSGANPARRGSDKFRDAYGEFAGQAECTPHRGADSGGASRFFPVFRYEAKAGAAERPRLEDGTAHPTVKPVDLMTWLVRLVTPPGGLVLDPFAGSGTTAEACIVEGFRCLLIEKDPKSAELIRERLRKDIQPTMFGGAA